MTSIRSIKRWLFTPATRPDRFAKGAAAGAGASIIDLEDSVAPPAKAASRATALQYLERLPSGPPVAMAAAVAGIHLVNSPYFHIADTDGLRRETKAAAALGYCAKCAIRPSQISVTNAVPMPSAEEIDKARKIVALEAQGAASLSTAADTADRQMVDKPVVRVPRLVLERAGVPASAQVHFSAARMPNFVNSRIASINRGPKRCPGRDDFATARGPEAANGAKDDIVGDFPVKFVGHATSLPARIHAEYGYARRKRRLLPPGRAAWSAQRPRGGLKAPGGQALIASRRLLLLLQGSIILTDEIADLLCYSQELFPLLAIERNREASEPVNGEPALFADLHGYLAPSGLLERLILSAQPFDLRLQFFF